MKRHLCLFLLVLCLVSATLASAANTFTFSSDGLSLFISNDDQVIRKVKEQTIEVVGCSKANCQISELFIRGNVVFYLHNKNQIRKLGENGNSTILLDESGDETIIQSFTINEFEEIIYSTQIHIKKLLSSGQIITIAGDGCEKNPDECIQPGHIAEDTFNEVIYFYDHKVKSIKKIEYETIYQVKGTFGYSTFDIKHGTIYCSDGIFIKRIQMDSSFDIIAGTKHDFTEDDSSPPDGTFAKDAKLQVDFMKISPVWGEEQVYFISTNGLLRKIDKNGKLVTIINNSNEIPQIKKTRSNFEFLATNNFVDDYSNNSTSNNSTNNNSTMNIDYYPKVNITSLISPDGRGIKFNVIYGRSDIFKHQLFFADESAYNESSCKNVHADKSIKLTLVEKSDTFLTQNYTSNFIPISTLLTSSSVKKETRGNYLELEIILSAQYVDEYGFFRSGYCYEYTYNISVKINLLIDTPSVTKSMTIDSQNYIYTIYPTNLNILSIFTKSVPISIDLIVESNFHSSGLEFGSSTSSSIQDFQVYSTENLGVRNSLNYSRYSIETISNGYDFSGSNEFSLLYKTFSGSLQSSSFSFDIDFILSFDIPQNNTCSDNGFSLSSSKCLCKESYYGNNCQLFKCFGFDSYNVDVCSGRGTCIRPNVCSCKPGFVGSSCQDRNDSQSFTISLSFSSSMVVQGSSQIITANITSTTHPISNLNFTLLCLNCGLGKSFSQSSSFSLDFTSLAVGNYFFNLFATTLDGGINSNVVDFVIQVTSQNERAIDSLNQFGIPSYFLRSDRIKFNPIFMNITLADASQVYDFKCLNQACSFKYTYSIKLKKLNAIELVDQGNGLLNGFGRGNSIVFSPMLQLSSVLSLNSDVTKVTIDLRFNNDLQNLFTFIEVPVYSVPQLPKQISISPSNGVAISTLFNMSSSEWIADSALLPLSFAYGFYHPNLKRSIRITPFSTSYTSQIPLPYISNSALTIVVYLSDVNGNIVEYTFGSIIVTSYSGSTSSLFRDATDELRTAILYDQSALSSSEFILEKIKSVVINRSNAENSLSVLTILTQDNTRVNQEIISQVTKTVNNFIEKVADEYNNEFNTYGFVKSKVSSQVLQSTLDVMSNVFISQNSSNSSSNSIDQTLSDFNSLIMRGQVPLVFNSEIQSESFTSSAITSSVASIVLSQTSSQSSVLGTFKSGSDSILLDVRNIAKSYGGESSIIGLSSITFTTNLNEDSESSGRNSSSSVLDFKYYQNFNYTKLSNLEVPITLSMTINKDSLDNLNNLTEIVCRYWNEETFKWSTDGCILVGFDNDQVNCSCNHTTKFSTFVENKYVIANVEIYGLYFAEIGFGIFFTFLSGIILILLVIFRNKQPVSSRLITPYLGMTALLAESILISIVQRSVLVDYVFQNNRRYWEDYQNAANIVGNITMIIVNTLNLTAILSYVIQVSRYELLKVLYNKISADQLEGSKRYKFLKVLTSSAIFITIISIFAFINICYWTLWVILVRVNVINGNTYTNIVSITYTTIIFLFSIAISIVAIIDLSITCMKKKEAGFTNLDAMGSTDLNSLRKKNRFSLFKERNTNLFAYDSPLFFRTEMILYLICFAFLIIQQSIGLAANEQRFRGSYDLALQYDIGRFVFEVLYQFIYVLVFGGFSLIILLKIHLQKKINSKKLDVLSEASNFLKDAKGHQVFEKFCITEFSTENLYLNDYLESNEMFTSGKYLDGLNQFMKNIFDLFINMNSVCEVNIPSSTKRKFVQLFKEVNSESFELNNDGQFNLRKQISDCFSDLKTQIQINLEDSFSRFIFSSLYEDFLKQKEMKENFAKQMRVDIDIENI